MNVEEKVIEKVLEDQVVNDPFFFSAVVVSVAVIIIAIAGVIVWINIRKNKETEEQKNIERNDVYEKLHDNLCVFMHKSEMRDQENKNIMHEIVTKMENMNKTQNEIAQSQIKLVTIFDYYIKTKRSD